MDDYAFNPPPQDRFLGKRILKFEVEVEIGGRLDS